MLIAESVDELRERMSRWKDCMEVKGLKVNIDKTKIMESGVGCGEVEKNREMAMRCVQKGCWEKLLLSVLNVLNGCIRNVT